MEIKANYLLIGIFALFGLFAGAGLLLWLAKVEIDRQYAYYDILFDNVSGLNQAGDVRYNGLPVGQVVGLRLDPEDPSKVRIRVEIGAETPVKTDTIAILESQGVTGVSYVSLSGGSPEAVLLKSGGIIRSQSSVLQTVLEGAPELLQKAVVLLEDINDVVNDRNRESIGRILDNIASASGRLDRALEDFETLSGELGDASQNVSAFALRLTELSESAETLLTGLSDNAETTMSTLLDRAETTLDAATETFETARSVAEQAGTAVDNANQTMTEMRSTFDTAVTFIETDLTTFTRQGNETAAMIETTLAALGPQASETMATANAALSQAETLFAAANTVVTEDIDEIFSDFRQAAKSFSSAVETASSSFTTISVDVLKASNSAANFTGMLETIVAENRLQVSSFLRIGLPEFTRLTEETRYLVNNLERLVDRAQRDPARFFLGTQGSEFSR